MMKAKRIARYGFMSSVNTKCRVSARHIYGSSVLIYLVRDRRVSYEQANKQDRLSLGMFGLMMLVYAWWAILVS